MKFNAVKTSSTDMTALESEFKNAHEIGVLKVGQNNLFFRIRLKWFYVPYTDLTRVYRRVQLIPASMCCGKGDLAIENLVLADDEKELAVIQLPGEKAGKAALTEIGEIAPFIKITKPLKKENETE